MNDTNERIPLAGRHIASPPGRAVGTLHIFVAFDWGSEIDLEAVGQLASGEASPLARRRRTPNSIAFTPPPVRISLPAAAMTLSVLGNIMAEREVTLFDFGAASVETKISFDTSAEQLLQLASSLALDETPVRESHAQAEDLFKRVSPAIQRPFWSALREEYFVFTFVPGTGLPPVTQLLKEWPAWLAGLARLENEALCAEEIAESLRFQMQYREDELLVPEWAAAVLIDHDGEEALQVMELANVQLLEYRQIDNRLDKELAGAYRTVVPIVRSWLPFWRTHMRPLRALGELRVDANSLFDRTSNVLKLMGDQYLARLYQRLANRFHLADWANSIRDSLTAAESVYKMVSDQAATYRTELLEVIIILLIVFEIGMAIWGH